MQTHCTHLIEHSVEELLRQRIFGLALGYEDLDDHDQLRHDPLLATLVGKADPTGADRCRQRDRGKALAGRNTLNRLELTPRGANASSRYKKIVADQGQIESVFVDVFLRLHPQPPERIVLDLDATDDPLHGDQLGKFFHGYYKCHCYLPLYIFCGDSGFCREPLMAWWEANGVGYILGLAKNQRLQRILGKELHEAKEQFEATGHAARVFIALRRLCGCPHLASNRRPGRQTRPHPPPCTSPDHLRPAKSPATVRW